MINIGPVHTSYLVSVFIGGGGEGGAVLGFFGKILLLNTYKLLSHDELSYKRNAPLLG